MRKLTKKQWLIAGALCALLLFAGLFIWNKINEPKDLGPKLIYIGKENTACEWWEIPIMFGWCRGPNYTYYFATDLSEDALKTYFSKANYVDVPNDDGGVGPDYRYTNIHYQKKTKPSERFYFNHFDEENTTKIKEVLGQKLKQTQKKYIISISADDYNLAKSAL